MAKLMVSCPPLTVILVAQDRQQGGGGWLAVPGVSGRRLARAGDSYLRVLDEELAAGCPGPLAPERQPYAVDGNAELGEPAPADDRQLLAEPRVGDRAGPGWPRRCLGPMLMPGTRPPVPAAARTRRLGLDRDHAGR